MRDKKVHFKLFKRGKNWCVAGITVLALGGMMMLGQNKAYADTGEQIRTELAAVPATSNSDEAMTSTATISNAQDQATSHSADLAKASQASVPVNESASANDEPSVAESVGDTNRIAASATSSSASATSLPAASSNVGSDVQKANSAATSASSNIAEGTDGVASAQTYSFMAARSAVKNGLQTENGNTYYYINGVRQSGTQVVNGKTYYFDPATQQMKNDYFYDHNGQMYYFGNDGAEYQDQFYSNWGNMYYFGKNGARYTDQFYSNWGNMYYFGDGGVRYTDQFYYNWGKMYYFGDGGVRYTDQFYSNWGNMYYFGDDGARYTNQFYSNWGNMYYFGEGGVRYTNQYYYNWGNTYYFGDGGVLLKNATQWLNSTMYHIDNDGVWIATNPTIEAVVNAAQSQIGLAPYTWGGGRTPASIAAHRFDCSSFVHWAFSQAGIILGNYTSATTWTLEGYGTPVDWSQLRRGDIFFMDDVNHVGIYLGDGYFIHDSPNSSTGGVGINRLTDQVPDLGTWEEIADNINRRIV